MKTFRYGIAAVLLACVAGAVPRATGQGLVPLNDVVVDPLLPAGLGRDAVELSGQYAYLWAQADGTQVIQYQGSFELLTGGRRMFAQGAVVWMSRAVWQNRPYYHYEVFLWREAKLIEAAGTTTSGPALFVTFNSLQPAEAKADATTGDSSAGTELYREGSKVREAVAKTTPITTQPGQMRVVPVGVEPPAGPKVRPIIQYRGDKQTASEKDGLVTAIGNVYVSQGLLDSADHLEIRADAAVVFLARSEGDRNAEAAGPGDAPPGRPAGPQVPNVLAGPSDMRDPLGRSVAGVYLEGNVILTRGERMIRAPQMYYDFENDRALILDAVMRAMVPDRDLPIYVRAKKVRQLSTSEYVADKAVISTSEFATPHVYVGAEKVILTDKTPRTDALRATGPMAGTYQAHDTTLNVEGVPILYWPYSQGDFRQTENLLRSARFGYDGKYGAIAQTKWYLFNLLGMQTPEGWDSALRLDYFSDHGPGVGIDFDYETEDYFGMFRGYYINDHGEDELGPYRSGPPDTENRGRVTWRHRHYLPKGWELTLEASYFSDQNFYQEYFPREFYTDKEQDTDIYLKKQQDNWAFSLLGQVRINDFMTQTEHLPDAAFDWIGQPLGEFASLFSESHIGMVRYRPADCCPCGTCGAFPDSWPFNTGWFNDDCCPYPVGCGRTGSSPMTFRGVTREEIDFPLKLGAVNVVPYATGRAGYWNHSPEEGQIAQWFGSTGLRTGSEFWRLFENVQSRLFDVNGVRHIVRPEMTAWVSGANKDSSDLYPFDQPIEDIDDFSGASVAIRNRWQTKRGGPGKWRVVDWITFDVEASFFSDTPKDELEIGHFYADRPENSIARDHVTADFSYRISDTTAILSDANWNIDSGNLDLFNASYAVERDPRLSYFFGYRYIGPADSNLLGFGANYQINTKHTIAIREYFDLERGETETFDITIIRRFPRWYAALTLGLDQIEDTISLSLSVWPEGVPEMALGNKKYTGLATSTGINAQNQN